MTKVKLTPYITLEGQAKEAIQFYEQTLGAEVLGILTYGDMPNMPDTFTEELKVLIAHAQLRIGESELMLSDSPGPSAVEAGKRITICITTDSMQQSRQVFEALQQGGQVNIPFGEEAFSPGFGDVTDRYGVTFQVYTEVESGMEG
ncbi:VOC family protein [Saccharibacillus sp. CPCC 101409]|uniref:VOC family protein n=1 Tax=Saccharibacillus sp. CPCC 101409 TaxID=3058041 RepID=UPI002671959F|nr:VOC family protein [Saccharibacillus sp. CPCC 101409]MDO3412583.1 VOC family protein [Saccharibacillus sp. CPCC 101409]